MLHLEPQAAPTPHSRRKPEVTRLSLELPAFLGCSPALEIRCAGRIEVGPPGARLSCWCCAFWVILLLASPGGFSGEKAHGAEVLIPIGAEWTYLEGREEASSPSDAWRGPQFDDATWPMGNAPFRYGDGTGGTELDDMRGNYTCIFLRSVFDVADPLALDALRLRVDYDDGFIAWINGIEVESSNQPAQVTHSSLASGSHEAGDYETFSLSDPVQYLTAGWNVLAIQMFNVSIDSSDLYLDLELSGVRRVADTKFSTDRGLSETPLTVEISSETPGATIRYTTDCSIPTETHGTLYSDPVSISTTTVLRAAAFKEGLDPTNVDTHTYVFPEDVILQPDQAPDGAFWNTEMDPEVVTDPRYRDSVIEALKAAPTVSIVAKPADLFSPEGIHWGDNLENRDLEVPCSIELIYPAGEFPGFQEDAGLRIQGGGGRWDEGTYDPKQSFAVKFKSEYGPSKLRYPFFESAPLHRESATDRFDRIILRAGHNKSWSGPGPGDREWVTYTRDQWARDTHMDLCGLDSHGTFVHLYLNGLYWGLYNAVERPDHNFMAAYFGGDGEDYYVKKKKGGSQTGDSSRYQLTQTVISDPSRDYSEVRTYLDTGNYIDWHLVMWSCGVADIQWYAGNRYEPPGPVRFWVWDAEDSWDPAGRAHDGYRFFQESDIFSRIQGHPDFRMELADRIQKHCFADGALTDQRNTARWRALCDFIELAVIGESARWGDERQHPPLNRDDHWYAARDMVEGFMQGNTQTMVDDLRARGYYPQVSAPVLSTPGGTVPAGTSIVIENPGGSGTIYYTSDGRDPRVQGSGELLEDSRAYTSPVSILGPITLRARILDGSEWSALSEAAFHVLEDLVKLRVTEIMYHPPALGDIDGDRLEFLELKNTGTQALDISGVRFTDGIDFTVPMGTRLAAGDFFVLASDPESFRLRYPQVLPDGTYRKNLSNAGENVRLETPEGALLVEVQYGDAMPWPEGADGEGYSLVPVSAAPCEDPGAPGYWRRSLRSLGSPAEDDGAALEAAPRIHRQPSDAWVIEGEQAVFTVWALGWPQPSFQWQEDREDLPGATDWYLVVDSYRAGSRYRCLVMNPLGALFTQEVTLRRRPLQVAGKLVGRGALWKYFEGITEPEGPTGSWRDLDFDDALWSEGSAPFGYGDGPFGTRLDGMQNRYTTVYCRRIFDLPEQVSLTGLYIEADYDDGFVAWINGTEVLRVNVEAGNEDHDGQAATGHESGNYERFLLAAPFGFVRAGGNILSIQGFNVDPGSSDFKLDLELAFEGEESNAPPPELFRRGDANADGITNITDGIFLLAFLFSGAAEPPCRASGDTDASGDLSITDAIYLLNHLFLGGIAPPAPYPECGLDPAPAAPSCSSYPLCRSP